MAVKKALWALTVATMTLAAVAASAAEKGGKTLVAYFSWGGNTRTIAEYVAEALDAPTFEIKTAKPYPEAYRPTTEVAKAEQRANARPELSTHVEGMESYDTVFLGYPNWWGTIPMALFTFLEEYDFSGKRVIPFNTHEGSGRGRSVEDIRRLIPGAKVEEGFAVRGGSVGGARPQVLDWIEGLGFRVKR